MSRQPDPQLYRAFTILSDAAIIVGTLLLLTTLVIDLAAPMALIISAGIAGLIVITARAAALRYR